MVITRGKVRYGELGGGKGGEMVVEGNLTWGGGNTTQYTDDVL